MLRWVGGGCVVLLAVTVGIIAMVKAQGVPEAELARRCAASVPAWNNYQEDIKGQVGAAPVAQWRGDPVWARHSGDRLEVAFALLPPWSEYACALPVLLRDPLGNDYRNVSASRRDGVRVYAFFLAEGARAGLPWVEVHYPHHQLRLALDNDGQWSHQP